MALSALKAGIVSTVLLTAVGCTTYSAKEYDPSKHRYPPSRYMQPVIIYPYPQDLDNYYIYGNGGNGYPIYNRGADNPGNYQPLENAPINTPSYDYPLYYQ